MSQFGSQLHSSSSRKLSGSGKKRNKNKDKKRHEMGGYFSATKLGAENSYKKVRGRGGALKEKLKYVATVNLLTKSGYKKTNIKAVVESKDNRNFARLNVITKGSVIDTDLGKAVVTSRPGSGAVISARLIE